MKSGLTSPCECVCGLSERAFKERYAKWCKKLGYYYNEDKAEDIYASSCGHINTLPMNDAAKLLTTQTITQLDTILETLAALRKEMNAIASSLPEYAVVLAMHGVGETPGPQLMAEIGDIYRFRSNRSLACFAGIESPPNQSGQFELRSRSISKRGSPLLRKTLFQIMSCILQQSKSEDKVYQFLDKKRSEGKPYRVYMIAGANKFLRIYYARVKEHLDALDA